MTKNITAILVCLCCISVPSRAQDQGDGVSREARIFEPYTKKEIAAQKRKLRDWSKGVQRIKSKKGTIAEVVQYIGKEFGLKLPLAKDVDQQRRVNFRGGKRTLDRCLANIGLRVHGRQVVEIGENIFVGRASVAQFYAGAEPWRGEKPGTIYHLLTTFSQDRINQLVQAVHWRVVGFKGKKPLIFESCKFHSPAKYMVRDGQEPVTSIQVEGEFWWTYKLVVTMEDFRNGDVVRIGKYDIKLAWPNIVVTLPESIPVSLLSHMLSFDAVMKTEPPQEEDLGAIGFGGGAGGTFGRQRSRDWCGCLGASHKGEPKGFSMWKVGQKVHAYNAGANKDSTLKDVKKLIIGIRLPVREKFKATLKMANQTR